MNREELLKEMTMNYETLIEYLKVKYGKAKYDYFCNETCKTKNKKVTRTKEGLFCHHIDEDKGCNLADSDFAKEQPFEYQKAERLVYCNYLEHLLLHILIGKNKYWKQHESFNKTREFGCFLVPGVIYICSSINSLFDSNGTSLKWQSRCFEEIKNNFDDYIYVLQSFVDYLRNNYEGDKESKAICVGQRIVNCHLGEGVVTKVTGEGPCAHVTIKFETCEETCLKLRIEQTYEDSVVLVKQKLSSNFYGNLVKLVYERIK